MHESRQDIAELQQLLDDSYAAAGAQLLSIHTPQRRLAAEDLAARLHGMRLLVLATATGDGRPLTGPVDGIFFRGRFYFGSDRDSLRFRHIRRRPHVSATHLPGEEPAVTVHGRAQPIELADHPEFRQAVLDVYVPRYGADWERWLDTVPVYARIDAERMFAFHMTPVPIAAQRGEDA